MNLKQAVFRSLSGILLLAPLTVFAQQKVDQLAREGERRADENAQAQVQVEKVADQTLDLVAEYRSVTKVVDGLKVYNGLLQRQVDNQREEMAALSQSIDNVALIERQIVPLMIRMIDALEAFVEADVPFLLDERRERVARLRDMMERSDVTSAEKFRRVIESYQIENEYGRTIEAYKGELQIGGQTRNVDFLRFGRVALVYQSVGGEFTGAWDQASGDWVDLPPEVYKTQVTQGLRIARKQVAPDLVVMPVPAARGVGQ